MTTHEQQYLDLLLEWFTCPQPSPRRQRAINRRMDALERAHPELRPAPIRTPYYLVAVAA